MNPKHKKNYFIIGLITIIPIFITFFIILWLFNLISGVSNPVIQKIFYFSNLEVPRILIQGLSFFVTLIFIWMCGFLVTKFIGKFFLAKFEKFVKSFPFIWTLYDTVRKLTTIIFPQDKSKYKNVVLVEYPRKGIYAIGFVTGEGFKSANLDYIRVFIPTTPNPTSGFLLLFKKDEIIYLDISIEDAFKIIISGGLISE